MLFVKSYFFARCTPKCKSARGIVVEISAFVRAHSLSLSISVKNESIYSDMDISIVGL